MLLRSLRCEEGRLRRRPTSSRTLSRTLSKTSNDSLASLAKVLDGVLDEVPHIDKRSPMWRRKRLRLAQIGHVPGAWNGCDDSSKASHVNNFRSQSPTHRQRSVVARPAHGSPIRRDPAALLPTRRSLRQTAPRGVAGGPPHAIIWPARTHTQQLESPLLHDDPNTTATLRSHAFVGRLRQDFDTPSAAPHPR